MRTQATLEGLGSLETQRTVENGVTSAELMLCNFVAELFMHPQVINNV